MGVKLGPRTKRTQIDGGLKQGVEKNIWTSDGGSGRRLEKTA
jgi:hypothetical protein